MRPLACLLVLLFSCAARGEVPPLLKEIADRWSEERLQWAFTQHVRETDGDGEVHERLERFDPSNGYDKRWRLLKLDGRAPSAQEIDYWHKKKNRKKKDPKSWLSFVDLEQARKRAEDERTISYEVPVKSAGGGLFPGNKISVHLTIDKRTRSIEQAHASVDEPFNVALGLAQVVDLDLNLELPADPAAGRKDTAAHPANDQARGTVSAVVNRMGKRVEYTWTDFRRAPGRNVPRS
jgi:hypothetical protein